MKPAQGSGKGASDSEDLQQLVYERGEEADQLRAQNKKLTVQLERKQAKVRCPQDQLSDCLRTRLRRLFASMPPTSWTA